MHITEAQKLVKDFAVRNGWSDEPNIDKFDHCHEELVEMSSLLRYKNVDEMKRTLEEKKELFQDGIGDLLFAVFRLANQLGIDAERAFKASSDVALGKYKPGDSEQKKQ